MNNPVETKQFKGKVSAVSTYEGSDSKKNPETGDAATQQELENTSSTINFLEKQLAASELSAVLGECGLGSDNPCMRGVHKRLSSITDENNLEQLQSAVRAETVRVEKALTGNLIIPDFSSFKHSLAEIYERSRLVTGGKVADYIPQLAKVSPDKFGVSVCTIDGQSASFGDSEEYFSIQSVSKPFNYCFALEEFGRSYVHKHVGREPSGRSFNEMTLDKEGRPHNPLINAGAIMSASMIKPDHDPADRFDFLMNSWSRLSGGGHPRFNNSVYLSEKQTADRNFALAYFMRERKVFPEGTSLLEVLDFYFQCCSVEMTTSEMSVVAATLANGGTCPYTGERIFSPETVKDALSLMYSCGMYDFSGEWAFSIGLPAKSGVGGGILVVVPNVLGICTWSPPLDSQGNSVRGIEFCRGLIEKFALHNYDTLVSGVTEKLDPCLRRHEKKQTGIVAMIWAASQGDVQEIKRLIAAGVNPDESDYDGRTPLHLASAEGHLEVVEFLLERGVVVNPQDRWGGTPADDARRGDHHDVLKRLEKMLKRRRDSGVMQ